ncbi:MAG: carbohydrate-binding protein [Salinivirgaceae bacterium]|jgi:hypothetical protein|nr:carbohydrate-binding protein [Salinivirgaceae bacterium]
MKTITLQIIMVVFASLMACNCSKDNSAQPEDYKMEYTGSPYLDTIRAFEVQTIPGKVECEFYDLGGDTIAYKDKDRNNNGSGSLNTGGGYLNTFRIDEAPDMSYTKFHDQIDNSPYNMVQPEKDQLYLGWTEPGEWIRYSVDVEETGLYQIGTMYTSNRGGTIQIMIDDTDTTALLNITSTYHPDEPIAWRQWHHWNFDDSIGVQHINAGRRIITLNIAEQGNFNFDYLLFTKLD